MFGCLVVDEETFPCCDTRPKRDAARPDLLTVGQSALATAARLLTSSVGPNAEKEGGLEDDDAELQAALRASLDEGGTPDYSHSVPGTKRQEWICVDERCLRCDCKELTTLEKRWIRSAVGSQLRTGFFALLPCTSGATSLVRSG